MICYVGFAVVSHDYGLEYIQHALLRIGDYNDTPPRFICWN